MASTRYELLRLLGSGGMAQIFEATAVAESGIQRRVAIKRILPRLAVDQRMQQLFFEEARVASQLHHGSIVQILDYGELDGSQFLVMEYVDGLDAKAAVENGRKAKKPIPEAVALHITCALSEALRYVHALRGDDGQTLGVVHRDVSPHNVLLSWEGDVKLSDFGIALERDRKLHTTAGIVRGKMHYLAPEQLLGERATSASDVYALGATLHALLAGTPPDSHKVDVVRIVSGEPPELDESLPDDILRLVRLCMTHDATSRPSAESVASMTASLLVDRRCGDGRGVLRTWLSELRAPASAEGSLDDLMGLVMSPGASDREYTVTPANPGDQRAQESLKRLTQPPPTAPETLDASPEPLPAVIPVTVREMKAPVVEPQPEPSKGPQTPSQAPLRGHGRIVIVAVIATLVVAALSVGAFVVVFELIREPTPVTQHSPNVRQQPQTNLSSGWVDEWHQGMLDDTDMRLPTDGSPYDEYLFHAPGGARVVVTLESTAFDTYLVIHGPDNAVVASNDDVATGNLNSRVVFIVPATGTYHVVANALRPEGRGPYRLHITTAPGS